MKSVDDRKKQIQSATNELLTDKFKTEIGQKARVERVAIETDEHQEQLRAVLSDIGENLQETGKAPKGMKYLGSFSVHVYHSEILRTAAFSILNNGSGVPFDLADAAMRELNGSVVEYHGKRRQKLRSGF